MKQVRNIFLAVVVVILVAVSSSSCVITNENQYSIVRQFGKMGNEQR